MITNVGHEVYKWNKVPDWLEQVSHGSRLVRASGSWQPIG